MAFEQTIISLVVIVIVLIVVFWLLDRFLIMSGPLYAFANTSESQNYTFTTAEAYPYNMVIPDYRLQQT